MCVVFSQDCVETKTPKAQKFSHFGCYSDSCIIELYLTGQIKFLAVKSMDSVFTIILTYSNSIILLVLLYLDRYL